MFQSMILHGQLLYYKWPLKNAMVYYPKVEELLKNKMTKYTNKRFKDNLFGGNQKYM